jgi:hypothetical protein
VTQLTRSGFGRGDKKLATWVGALGFVDDPAAHDVSRALGRATTEAGLTRLGWQLGSHWMQQWGLDEPFAEGCWAAAEAGELERLPEVLVPLAEKLGLFSLGQAESTDSVEPEDSQISVSEQADVPEEIDDDSTVAMRLSSDWTPGTPSLQLRWLRNLIALRAEDGSTEWLGGGGEAEGEADLTLHSTVVEDWLAAVLEAGQSEPTAERGVVLWPIGGTVIGIDTSSGRLTVESDRIILSLQVDLGGDIGLVQPWAAATLNGSHLPVVENAPSGLDGGWLPLHDFLCELLVQAVVGFPRQLMIGLAVPAEVKSLTISGSSLLYTLKPRIP